MALPVFKDNAYGTIGSGIGTTDTSIALTTGHGVRFPTIASPQVMYATLVNSSNVVEQIKITAHAASSDTLTVTRAANSTTAKAWSAGDRIEARLTSEWLNQPLLVGTTAADDASAGVVGEAFRSAQDATSFSDSTLWVDACQVNLTAGDWDVTLVARAILNGATMTAWDIGISSTAGNSGSGLTRGDNWLQSAYPPTGVADASLTIANFRVNQASSVTWYAKMRATYSAGTPQYSVRLSARRVR